MAELDRARVVDFNLEALLRELAAEPPRPPADPDGPVREGFSLTRRQAVSLFESQVTSRAIDLEARAMRGRNQGFYTISSSGHEGNAVVGALTRASDPALLHYRSGAFFIERAKKVAAETPVFDMLLGIAGSAEDPISGGRHKVFGSKTLAVPPMTSTIASHLPRAVGAAFFLERGRRLGLPLPCDPDGIVVCSFGDATVNHSVAAGAFNAVGWAAYQSMPAPILFVCEDNGVGISVRTPAGWIERSFGNRPGIRYFRADGLDLVHAWETTKRAVDRCRRLRAPVFLHLEVVRLLGHAGSDVESGYRTRAQIEEAESRDPLLATARMLCRSGAATGDELLRHYARTKDRVRACARESASRPRLESASQILSAFAGSSPEDIHAEASRPPQAEVREQVFGGAHRLPERDGRSRNMSQIVAWALRDLLARYDDAFVFGEDVAKKGGVYYATAGLLDAFGKSRVFNTLLDETTILGIALGAGLMGYLPIPEIQYLAYLHNAEDQLRGEAAALGFFANRAYRNPLVVRIASFAYQRGFGGHFHNDNSIAVLRDIPGIVIAAPARPADAAGMLRTVCAAAKLDGRVAAFLEPIALYKAKDLFEPGDDLWAEPYPGPSFAVPLGEARVTGDGDDLVIVTYANGVPMSLRAARTLAEEHGIHARVVDLRWLAPLDIATIRREAERCGKALIVDEGRRTGGVGEGVMTAIATHCDRWIETARVCGEDTFIPLGDAADLVLPSEADVVTAALALYRPGEST